MLFGDNEKYFKSLDDNGLTDNFWELCEKFFGYKYIINYQDMQGLGMTGNLALPTLIAISSAALSKPPISSLAVLGEISIGGTLIKVEDLASTLQVCLDSGAKKVLLPITSAADLGTVPSDLVGAFSLIFYSSPEEAVYKALGVA